MKSKIAVVAISAASFGYLGLALFRASQFGASGSPIAAVFAISVFAVVTISALLIIREILFGVHISQMATVLEAEDLLLADSLPHTNSGLTEKPAADERFAQISKELDANPDSWRAWFRVASAYDEARDRKRARAAMRRAEKIFRAES